MVLNLNLIKFIYNLNKLFIYLNFDLTKITLILKIRFTLVILKFLRDPLSVKNDVASARIKLYHFKKINKFSNISIYF